MDSILSTGEREVASMLASGRSLSEVAEARDTTEERVERTAERVREKTDRALATLAESHVADEAVDALDPETRAALGSLFEE